MVVLPINIATSKADIANFLCGVWEKTNIVNTETLSLQHKNRYERVIPASCAGSSDSCNP
jgi:hypothetical protein